VTGLPETPGPNLSNFTNCGKPLPLRELAGFRAAMPRLRRPAAELLHEMRNEGP